MKILHVCETIKGGVATWLNMFQSICGDVVENAFVVPEDHASQLAHGSKVETFVRSGRGIGPTIQLGRAAKQFAKDFNPDVIWCQSTYSLGALAYLKLHQVPATYLYCPHAWAQLRYTNAPIKRHLIALAEGKLAGMADLVVNICHNDKRVAENCGYGGKHAVVENAMPDLIGDVTSLPSPFSPSEKRINILFVGRFERQKGIDILLDAMAAAVPHNTHLHLHVVGAGVNSNDEVRRDLAKNVTFHSWVSSEEIPAYYSHAHALIMPSRWEGLPMVLIESLRVGTPVILANVAGMGELLDNGLNGIVLTELSVASFAKTLIGLDSDTLDTMRPAARAQYETRYSAPRFRAEMLRLLAALPVQPPLILPNDIVEAPQNG